MTFTFRNDQPDVAISIMREVGQWLVNNNMELWDVDALTADNLVDAFTQGNFFVMYADSGDGMPEPAATFILQWEDPLYWPDVPANTSGFIHKLAIRRPFAGQNLFRPLLDFCLSECLKREIHIFQLETDATKPSLMRFYERYGFTPTYQRTIHEFGQSFLCQFYVIEF